MAKRTVTKLRNNGRGARRTDGRKGRAGGGTKRNGMQGE